MASKIDKISIDGKSSIGSLLKAGRLYVPPNQREYSWKEKHVNDLYTDLRKVIEDSGDEYFLGSVVMIESTDERLMVVDGQQRLATSLILLAAIRDYHDTNGDESGARSLENEFLFSDEYTSEGIQHLQLNSIDEQYFYERVILPQSHQTRRARMKEGPTKPSHKRIANAAKYAEIEVKRIVGGNTPQDGFIRLKRWVKFILSGAKVIAVTVPDESAAYVIFETMNDRGLALSATDLIKNYLLGLAGTSKIEIVKQNWSRMIGALETVGSADITKTFVRHFWISRNGLVRSADLFASIKLNVRNSLEAVGLSEQLAEAATSYAAIMNPSHPSWKSYGAFADDARKGIAALNMLGVLQIRPMLLSALIKFNHKEVSLLLKKSVSWAVRLTFAGIQGTGELEKIYSSVPVKIFNGDLKTAKDVAGEMLKDVPKDNKFEEDFSQANVRRADLARFYLRALERTHRNEPEPAFIPNEETIIDREHIMPEGSDQHWGHISKQIRETYVNRLGNQALLKEKENSLIGNESFAVKQPVLQQSDFQLTQQAGNYSQWTDAEIEDRQKFLAKLAVKTWSIK
jgi:hypothetical protein